MEEKILKILQEINDEIMSYEGTNLCHDGLLDSFQIIELAARLEEEFEIEIEPELINTKEFATKESIINLVRSIIEKKHNGMH